jgi:hypothetical protein
MPRKSPSTRQEAVPVAYSLSDDVESRARRIMGADVALRSLAEHNIAFVLVENRKDPGGRVDRWVRTTKAPPLWAGLTEYEAVVAVNDQKWSNLSETDRDNALRHGLRHLSVDERGKIAIEAHDFEGFGSEVRHGGAWTPELTVFVEALTLFGKNGAGDDEEDLRPKGPVNTDALRGEADRSIVKEPTPSKGRNGQSPASPLS